MTHIDLAILNSHLTVIYLKFIKSSSFYVVKQKNCIFPCYLFLYIRCTFFEAGELLVT